MRVLVTGANGMLATNLIEELLRSNYMVRGILRNKNRYQGLHHNHLELIEGDFTDFDTMQNAVTGCDYIIHAAGITAQNHVNYEEYRRVNVEATERLLKIALINRIERFVFVSSANTIGYGTYDHPGTEDTFSKKPLTGSMYARSKAEAERIVLSYSKMLDVVVVNPTFMVGRYGSDSGSNRILKMAKRTVVCPSGGKSFIDVACAARGIVSAMQWGSCGNKYLISGENLSFKEFFSRFNHVERIVVVPRVILLTIGLFGSLLRSVGVKLSLSLTNARILCTNCFYSNDKAKTEFGFTHTSISEIVNSNYNKNDEK